jgi:3-hydroxyisobutyrate dehydrogenase
MRPVIAIIGVGIMGNGIADNVLKKGYKVVLWNRTSSKLKNLVVKGATLASSPKEAAQNSDMVFEVSANDESSQKIWLGKDGIFAGSRSNSVLITCATLSIDWTEKLARKAKSDKRTFFDMPMTGGRPAAEGGKLFLLVGGDEKKLRNIEPDLKAIAGSITYFGKAGMGMKFKLLLNTLQAIHGTALGEILDLAKKTGQDVKKVGAFLSERPGGTATNNSWTNYLSPPKETSFSLDWMTKDLRYTKKMVRSTKSKTPFLDSALEKLEKGIRKKMGTKDWTLVNKI